MFGCCHSEDSRRTRTNGCRTDEETLKFHGFVLAHVGRFDESRIIANKGVVGS